MRKKHNAMADGSGQSLQGFHMTLFSDVHIFMYVLFYIDTKIHR